MALTGMPDEVFFPDDRTGAPAVWHPACRLPSRFRWPEKPGALKRLRLLFKLTACFDSGPADKLKLELQTQAHRSSPRSTHA